MPVAVGDDASTSERRTAGATGEQRAAGLRYVQSGDGDDLVLLHGFGGCLEHWGPVVGKLAVERRVTAVDLPGFGRSEAWGRGRRFSIGQLVDRVEAFLDAVGLDAPAVAGNSLGGVVALELAKRRRATSVTVLSPAAFIDGASKLYVAGMLGGLQSLTRVLPGPLVNAVLSVPPVRRSVGGFLVRRPHDLDPDVLRSSAQSIRRGPSLLLHALGLNYSFRPDDDLGVPVTVAWGTHDRVLWARQVRTARRVLPEATLVPLPGCGHVPMSDDPELVAQVLLDGSVVR
jgi:pimeloyl-ACP methyl ester carboxylesterase